MDLSGLLELWDVVGPWRLGALADGTNNLVYRAESAAGGGYVLRVYGNHADAERLRFEHSVLAGLDAVGLPFAVPAPVRTRTGETFAHVMTEDGNEALATLTRLIPGAAPESANLEQAVAAGEALGLLDEALPQIGTVDGEQGVSWRSYGDLEHCHPLVPDPRGAIGELPVAEETRTRLAARYDWLMEQIPDIYATLPRQLVHEDYAPDNMLMDGARVTGVLDFEFCTRDVRVMDLTVALSWWPVRQLGTGDEWPIIEAVSRGYGRRVVLAAEEIGALPALYELRAYTSLIHRLGRYRAGVSPMEAVVGRAHAALKREEWLRANGERLKETVRAAR